MATASSTSSTPQPPCGPGVLFLGILATLAAAIEAAALAVDSMGPVHRKRQGMLLLA